jgi:hypothetical protein
LIIVAVLTSVGTLAVAFLLRFLYALQQDSETITVAPHLRVAIASEATTVQTPELQPQVPVR